MMYTESNIDTPIVSGKVRMGNLTKILMKLKTYAYSYLTDIQKEVIDFKIIHLKFSDFTVKQDIAFTKVDLDSMYQYNIKMPFIHYNNRLAYRKSGFFNIPITMDDVFSNPNIFLYSYFVFIDGYYDADVRFLCNEEITSICLSKQFDKLKDYFLPDKDVDILIVPNNVTLKTTTSRNITYSSKNRVYAITYTDETLPKLFIPSKSSTKITLPATGIVAGKQNKVIIIDIPNFLQTVNCSDTYFTHNNTNMPIPVENIIPMVSGTDGSIRFPIVNINKKYPEIYQLEPHSNPYIFDIFYYDSELPEKYKYETEKYATMINIFNAYKDGTINENISSYNPYLYDYSLNDYHETHTDVPKQTAVYKVNKMLDVFKLFSFASRLYYEDLVEPISSYGIYLNGLEDRKRLDNRAEIVAQTYQKDFDSPRYLFSFPNKSLTKPLPYKFWIDGIRYVPDEMYLDGAFEYIYIQGDKLKENSVVRIERSNDLKYEYSFKAVTGKINLKLKGIIPINAIYVYDNEYNFIPKNAYTLSVTKKGINFGVIDNDSEFWLDNTCEITFTPKASIKNKIITIGYNERPIEFEVDLTQKNFFLRDVNYQKLINGIKLNGKIRVFREGRLVPEHKYTIHKPDKFNGDWQIELEGFGSIYTYQCDYIPEGYNQIYYLEEVPDDGLINLSGIIDKPFSNHYYDIYINGFRIFPNQIEYISDFTIRLKNLRVLNKLYIYEKDVTYDGIFQLETEDAKRFLNQKLAEDPTFLTELRKHIERMIAEYGIRDVDDFDNALDIICNDIANYIEASNTVIPSIEIDNDFFELYRYWFGSDDIFFIDPNVSYYDKRPIDYVYYIAPRRDIEIHRINRFYFVEQYGQMINSMDDVFINPNNERPVFDTFLYPNVEEDTKDGVIMINGHHYSDRHNSVARVVGA